MDHGSTPGWSGPPHNQGGAPSAPQTPPAGYGPPYQNYGPPPGPGSTGPIPQQQNPYGQGPPTGPWSSPIPQQQQGGWSQGQGMPPTPPPGAQAPPSLGAPQGGRPWGKIAIAGLLVAALAVGGVVGYGYFFGDTAEASVALEAVSTTGTAPFTAPVGTDAPGAVAPAGASGAQPGNTGGLYAQDPAELACDRSALVSQLQGDPAKASAWANALKLTGPDQIGPFAQSLTPVTLRADTSVTQYGYRNGAYQSYPSILQSGTAVLVNSYGEPTVKCFNGNPLGAATASNAGTTYRGASWAGFAGTRTISIVPSNGPIRALPVLNPRTNAQNPVPVRPNPGRPPGPNQPPQVDKSGKLVLTGPYTSDGGMLLADGSVLRPDGKIVKPAPIPAGAKTLDGGGYQLPDGRVFNLDGSERKPIKVSNDRMLGTDGILRVINPDGTVGAPVKMTPGTNFQFNYDGSVLAYSPLPNDPNQVSVTLVNPDGTKKFNQVVPRKNLNSDGSITSPDGRILNPDGTPRQPITLANGVVQFPDGTQFDPKTGLTGGTKITDPSVPSQAERQKASVTTGGGPLGQNPGLTVPTQPTTSPAPPGATTSTNPTTSNPPTTTSAPVTTSTPPTTSQSPSPTTKSASPTTT